MVFKAILNKINSGHERTRIIKWNIIYSFLIKIAGILLNLIIVPVTIHYINPENYGIWLTLSSVVGWISFFDVGFGNGLRNKLSEAITAEDTATARTYVSTTYACMIMIFASLAVLFVIVNPFLNWNSMLNASKIQSNELNLLVLVVFITFCFRFILQPVQNVLFAVQRSAAASMLQFMGVAFSFIFVWILTRVSHGNFFWLGIIFSGTPVLVFIIANLYFFAGRYRHIAPSFSFVKMSYAKNILDLGLKFFVIQISGLITFSSLNFLITHLFNPVEVTKYNIVYKYFSTITMFYGILLTPFWSATTDAYYRHEYGWIKNALKKYNKISAALISAVILMLVVSPFMYKMWVGDEVQIGFLLSFAIALDTIIYIIFSPYTAILNGIGKLKVVLYYVSIQTILFIPFVLLVKHVFNLGVAGLTLSSITLKAPLIALQFVQVRKLLNDKAQGIWNE
ncbi:MAG: oligosaccharide flippase family protein [Ignavibacteria bacterium]|nr:oligosaccharide flippase family protein [Ignavibacteria bacterium]